jgi:hypothetical protein
MKLPSVREARLDGIALVDPPAAAALLPVSSSNENQE